MAELVQNRWVQLVVVGAAMAVLGAVAGVVALSGPEDAQTVSVGDRVMFTSGGTVQVSGDGGDIGTLAAAADEKLPLTSAQAVAAGWKDPVLCSVGRGRYFQKGPGGEGVPYFPMFNRDDALIGIYHFSETEMPPPWTQMDELYGGGGLKLLDAHWGTFVYFQDPTRACGVVRASHSDYSAP